MRRLERYQRKAVRYCITGRRCGDGGEQSGHASRKRLASCRQAWCGLAAMTRAGGQRMGSEAPCGFRRRLAVMYEPTVTRTLQDSF